MKDTLGAWAHAKTRPDIVNRRARRVYGEIVRSGGIGNVDRLAKLCGMTPRQVHDDLETLTAAGLLKRPVVLTVETEAA
jgi:DeoR/GlpR family transcriptional regulator of sugar metabolism